MMKNKWGLYVHVPFCLNKCLYCDFYSETDLSVLDEYVLALEKEMEFYSGAGPEFDSIYFGGGTPSILGGERVSRIMEAIHKNFKLSPESEITLEANPGAVTKSDFSAFLASGITRLNFGVQSFNDRHLKTLGRIHSSSQAMEALEDARNSGFANIGLDIIFAIPGQTFKDLGSDISRLSLFSPEHVSCYSLTFEEGTPFYGSLKNGSIRQLCDDDSAQMFIDAGEMLSGHGYRRYEVSNFGKIKSGDDFFYSRHNMKYWSHVPYIGLGPAAHSFDGRRRWWKQRDIHSWIKQIQNGEVPLDGEEILSVCDLMTESIFLSLRTFSGLDTRGFMHKYGFDIGKRIRNNVEFYEAEGFAVMDAGRLILTEKGFLAADAITREILSAAEEALS